MTSTEGRETPSSKKERRRLRGSGRRSAGDEFPIGRVGAHHQPRPDIVSSWRHRINICKDEADRTNRKGKPAWQRHQAGLLKTAGRTERSDVEGRKKIRSEHPIFPPNRRHGFLFRQSAATAENRPAVAMAASQIYQRRAGLWVMIQDVRAPFRLSGLLASPEGPTPCWAARAGRAESKFRSHQPPKREHRGGMRHRAVPGA